MPVTLGPCWKDLGVAAITSLIVRFSWWYTPELENCVPKIASRTLNVAFSSTYLNEASLILNITSVQSFYLYSYGSPTVYSREWKQIISNEILPLFCQFSGSSFCPLISCFDPAIIQLHLEIFFNNLFRFCSLLDREYLNFLLRYSQGNMLKSENTPVVEEKASLDRSVSNYCTITYCFLHISQNFQVQERHYFPLPYLLYFQRY